MSPRPAARWSAQLARAGAHHIKLPLASKNPIVMRRNAGALKNIIRRHRIDIVHARSRAPAWSALWAARATRRRFVTTFHNAYDTDLPLKRWYNSVMARGERVIAISQFVGEHAAAPTASARTGCASSRAASISRLSIRIGCAATGSRRWRGNGGCRTTSRS